MNEKYARPIMIIQGEKKHLSGIGESAFYGALASVLADFRVPIFFAVNEKEVSELIFHIARREQMEKKKDTKIREGRKPASLSENQRYIVSGIPGMSGVLADRLLTSTETIEKLILKRASLISRRLMASGKLWQREFASSPLQNTLLRLLPRSRKSPQEIPWRHSQSPPMKGWTSPLPQKNNTRIIRHSF